MSSSDEEQVLVATNKLSFTVLKTNASTEDYLRWRASLINKLSSLSQPLDQEIYPPRPALPIMGVTYRRPELPADRNGIDKSFYYHSDVSNRAKVMNIISSAVDKETAKYFMQFNDSANKDEPLRVIQELDKRFGVHTTQDLHVFCDKFHTISQGANCTAFDYVARLQFYANELVKRGFPLTAPQLVIGRFLSGARNDGDYTHAKRAIMEFYDISHKWDDMSKFHDILSRYFDHEKFTQKPKSSSNSKDNPQKRNNAVLAVVSESPSYNAIKGKGNRTKNRPAPYNTKEINPDKGPQIVTNKTIGKFCSNCGQLNSANHTCTKRPLCTHCQKPGHLEANCWIKDPSKRPPRPTASN